MIIENTIDELKKYNGRTLICKYLDYPEQSCKIICEDNNRTIFILSDIPSLDGARPYNFLDVCDKFKYSYCLYSECSRTMNSNVREGLFIFYLDTIGEL